MFRNFLFVFGILSSFLFVGFYLGCLVCCFSLYGRFVFFFVGFYCFGDWLLGFDVCMVDTRGDVIIIVNFRG